MAKWQNVDEKMMAKCGWKNAVVKIRTTGNKRRCSQLIFNIFAREKSNIGQNICEINAVRTIHTEDDRRISPNMLAKLESLVFFFRISTIRKIFYPLLVTP